MRYRSTALLLPPALATTEVDRCKKLKTMVEGQAAMNSTRQRGTGSDGWTRDYFDVRDASAGGADGVGGSI